MTLLQYQSEALGEATPCTSKAGSTVVVQSVAKQSFDKVLDAEVWNETFAVGAEVDDHVKKSGVICGENPPRELYECRQVGTASRLGASVYLK